jgi:Ataxin-2 C-terminal region
MSQENSSDLSTKFSTLNVNAMEFVPSFCTSTSENSEEQKITDEVMAEKTPDNNGEDKGNCGQMAH